MLTRDVDHPARRPFQDVCSADVNPYGQAHCSIAEIPANTEFVIQTVSASGSGGIPTGGLVVMTNNGSSKASNYLPIVQQTPNYWAATQAVTMYAGPTSIPSCDDYSSPGGNETRTFVGYLLSLQ